MKAVGVKVLKARLSEYLRLVKAGETVLVTERDEVVAEIRPARRQTLAPQEWDEILDQLSEQGRATLRAQEPSTWKGPTSSVQISSKALDQLLDDLRKDRS
jgi:antitoxin (DNA-binding transcriptional repressor) of toxin-antitoxin stability system